MALARLRPLGAEALLVCAAPFFDTRRSAFGVRDEAAYSGHPSVSRIAARGGVMSYGVWPPDSYRQVGSMRAAFSGALRLPNFPSFGRPSSNSSSTSNRRARWASISPPVCSPALTKSLSRSQTA